eukprot:Hpha_TRINITY_DN12586_c0_g1::TRINITY_DN12586_c0_g1_i1::g.51038::m.51038/K17263/CAND1; cullin-associated NEDD8-dissociated protein 1
MPKRWDFAGFHQDMTDPDPDKPHQALFDLNQELTREDFTLDEATQVQVVDDVLKLALKSGHSDVQGAAVKCIPPLVKKVREHCIERIVDRLAEPLQGEKKEPRDIASISLKYVVEHIPSDARNGIRRLAGVLLNAIRRASHEEVKLESMEVTTNLLRRFGNQLTEEHEGLQGCLLNELGADRMQVRKKAITCLSVLSIHSSETLFQSVVSAVVSGIEREKGQRLRKYIQLCSAISRTAGHRLGRALGRIVPLLLDNLSEKKLEQIEEDNERNEVRENVLQAFESFFLRCPQQSGPWVEKIVEQCKVAMSHDPYYDYDDDDEEDGDTQMDGDDDEFDEQMEADVDDDDDVSWKVRKAGAKCLSALLETRSDALPVVYVSLCSKAAREADLKAPTPSARTSLPERFKEREESVRLDIFKVFIDLLRASQVTRSVTSSDVAAAGSLHGALKHRPDVRAEVQNLADIRDFVVQCVVKALKDKSVKVKTTCFQLLREMTLVLRERMEPEVSKLLSAVKDSLAARDATSALKTEALQFMHSLVVACPPDSPELQKSVPQLLPLVLAAVGDRYYKITSEALRVCGELTHVVVQGSSASCANQLYGAVHDRLATADVDQEVKDAAISTMGSILRHAASAKMPTHHLEKEKVRKSQEQFLALLNGDYSRIPVIKTLAVCKDVDVDPDLLNKFVQEITGFLRKASRPLRQASLHTLKVLVEEKHGDVDAKLFLQLLQELSPLFSDQDLHLSHLALDLCDAVLHVAPAQAVAEVEEHVLPKFVDLIRSPLMQGSALESLENVFETLGPKSKMGYQVLLQEVLGAARKASGGAESRQVMLSVAAVAAKLTRSASADEQAKTTESYVAMLSEQAEEKIALGLACLGEEGRYVDLSTHPTVRDVVSKKFEYPREDVKTLAAISLGKITRGSVAALLPGLIKSIETNERDRCLLLRALREALGKPDGAGADHLRAELKRLLEVCINWAAAGEEGIRNVVSECLGRLAVLEPRGVSMNMLEEAQKAGPMSDRTTTIIASLKYAIADPGFAYDTLHQDMNFFLQWMAKPEEPMEKEKNAENVKTRRAAVQLFTAAVHSKPDLVRAELRRHMTALYTQTKVDDELVRSVNLGPFVHKVDDGIELRKSAFECMDILLDGTFTGDSLLDYLNDYDSFAQQLVRGMESKQGQDIQMLCYFMMAKLCRVQRAHVAVLSILDSLFADTLLSKAVKSFTDQVQKVNVVQQEKDKLQDVMTSLFRMVDAVRKVPGAEDNALYQKFVRQWSSSESQPLQAAMAKAVHRDEAAGAAAAAH